MYKRGGHHHATQIPQRRPRTSQARTCDVRADHVDAHNTHTHTHLHADIERAFTDIAPPPPPPMPPSAGTIHDYTYYVLHPCIHASCVYVQEQEQRGATRRGMNVVEIWANGTRISRRHVSPVRCAFPDVFYYMHVHILCDFGGLEMPALYAYASACICMSVWHGHHVFVCVTYNKGEA